MKVQEFDLSKLDFNEIGSWPLPMRIVAFVLIGVVVNIASYFMFINNQLSNFTMQYNRQISLRSEFKDKYHKAANLEAYKHRMEEMKNTLRILLRQLPTEGRLPSLMEDISLQASAAGLEFNLIKPGDEVSKEFYTELPIKMSILGSYHGFGVFISGIAKLPRIVTLHDFEITMNSKNNDGKKRQDQPLTMSLEAKTYWCANRENL
jgi:type IV pilus assembly protein PilO